MVRTTAPPRQGVQMGIHGYGIFGRFPEQDLVAAMRLVKDSGAVGVEVMSNLLNDPTRLQTSCTELGLVVSGVHVFWSELSTRILEAVDQLNARWLIVSGVPCSTSQACEGSIGGLLNWAARAQAASAGLLVHNHAEECVPLADGRTPLEIIAESTPPHLVKFLVDVFWAMRGGAAPEKLFETLRGRCPYLHLKDGPQAVGDEEETASYGLGDGDVPLRDATACAIVRNELDWVVIERDRPAKDPAVAVNTDIIHANHLIRDILAI